MIRVLVAGWFSFTEVVATVGDERAAEVVCERLQAAGIDHDVAWAEWLHRGPPLSSFEPVHYTHLLWVCGPLIDVPLVVDLLERFASVCRLAVGVSLVDSRTAARFDRIWARDGPGREPVPDLACASTSMASAVLATVFAPAQREYGARGRHEQARRVIEEWIAVRRHGSFDVATDLLTDAKLPRHATQVVAALSRADAVVTTRLHGLVLARAAGRPVIAVDPVLGGAKVSAQAGALGWPVSIQAEELSRSRLDAALVACLDAPAVATAPSIEPVMGELISALITG